ncbi:DUF6572 domain-containing protein [Spirillospora sp. NPDC047279]|uniref:DUF6572 domain-containing protein n=1 Tax=Spirillospora sp. NPDC047279 TaxID=3155478 RepID=UPI0033ED2719
MTVEDFGTVDEITATDDGSSYTLVMVETRPFEMSERQTDQLLAKINSYLDIIQSGKLVERFPEMAGKEIKVRLVCMDEPSHPKAMELLSTGAALFRKHGVDFAVEVVPREFIERS